MKKVNSLSRRLDQKIEVKRDNENEILVWPKWLEVKRIEKVEVIIERVDLLEKVRQSKVKDNKVVKIVKKMKWTGVKMLQDEEQKKVDGIIYKERKIYISKNDTLRAEIIKLHYNTLVKRYERQQKTVELVTRNFQQPEVTKKVKQYIKKYNFCQRNKNHTKQPAGKLLPRNSECSQWSPQVDVQEELDGVLRWIAALFILLLQWLYPRVPWSHDLSRMFYGHMTLSHDLAY